MSHATQRAGGRPALGASALLFTCLLAWPAAGLAQAIELRLSPPVSPAPDDPDAPLPVEQLELANVRESAGEIAVAGDVVLHRRLDLGAAPLFGLATTRPPNLDATIAVYEPIPGSPDERRLVEEYDLDDVLVTSWRIELVAGFGLVEVVHLFWTRMEKCTFAYDEAGEPAGESCGGWDQLTATPWARP